jgi:hypothetical protein
MSDVRCPYCNREIDDAYVQSHVARRLGRIKSPKKGKRDPEELSRMGKLGGWPKGKPRGPRKQKE